MEANTRSGVDLPPLLTAVVAVAAHLLTSHLSGYHRDEFYYLACASHLGFGYVDHPPLVALLTWLSRSVLGDSQVAIRVLPALAGGASVYLAGLTARHFGAGRLGTVTAGVAVLAAPVLVAMFGVLSMNGYDVLLWTAAVYLVARLLGGADSRLWLVFGVVAGLGLQNKLSVLFLGFGLLVGLVAARRWDVLGRRWVWMGAAPFGGRQAPDKGRRRVAPGGVGDGTGGSVREHRTKEDKPLTRGVGATRPEPEAKAHLILGKSTLPRKQYGQGLRVSAYGPAGGLRVSAYGSAREGSCAPFRGLF